MRKLFVALILITSAVISFNAQADVTRSCNFTANVYGCAVVITTTNGTQLCQSKVFLGSKSGTMSGTAITAYGARVKARKTIFHLAKSGSTSVLPAIDAYIYNRYSLIHLSLNVTGDTGCKIDRGFNVPPHDLY